MKGTKSTYAAKIRVEQPLICCSILIVGQFGKCVGVGFTLSGDLGWFTKGLLGLSSRVGFDYKWLRHCVLVQMIRMSRELQENIPNGLLVHNIKKPKTDVATVFIYMVLVDPKCTSNISTVIYADRGWDPNKDLRRY